MRGLDNEDEYGNWVVQDDRRKMMTMSTIRYRDEKVYGRVIESVFMKKKKFSFIF